MLIMRKGTSTREIIIQKASLGAKVHKGDKTDIYKKMIVPINHEKARSMLRERA